MSCLLVKAADSGWERTAGQYTWIQAGHLNITTRGTVPCLWMKCGRSPWTTREVFGLAPGPAAPITWIQKESGPPILDRTAAYPATAFTPYSRDTPMYGVEVHANVMITLLQAGPINEAPLFAGMTLVFFLAAGSMPLFRLKSLLIMNSTPAFSTRILCSCIILPYRALKK